ncbi:MAG: hypothetical protein ACRDJH_01050 [Thermomicrobiales bacterium]
MRLSRWVLAITFALSLVTVAGWVTLAQDDGKVATTEESGDAGAGAGVVNSSGDATTDETASGSSGDAGDGTGSPGDARGLRGERFSSATIDLGPLGDLLDFGLEDVKSDVEARAGVLVLDTILRESALLNDLGDDEILSVDRTAAELDLDRIDDVLSDAEANPIDDLDPVNFDVLLTDLYLVEPGVGRDGENGVDVTSDVNLDNLFNDLDGLRLLDDRNTDDVRDRVNLDDLFAGAILRDLAVVELDEPFTDTTTDDVLANLGLLDTGNLDTLVPRDDDGRRGELELIENLDDLDRLDDVDLLGRLDGRVLPNAPIASDLNVLEELDTARTNVLEQLELFELFNLGELGLRDGLGLGLGPP